MRRISGISTARKYYFILLLCCISPAAALFKPQQASSLLQSTITSTATMAPKASPPQDTSSSVLGELKDTIRKQQAEIEGLKKQVVGSKPSVSHGGHGGGAELSEDEVSQYLTQSFHSMALSRVGWLALFLVSLSFTAVIMNGFEHTLERQIELAYFVPLLAGHGGNTGGQTVGTVLSAMSAKCVTLKDAPRVVAKEALAGALGGILLSMGVAPTVHYVMGISYHVSVVIFLTLPLVSTIAATLGSAIPFACVAMGLDPSVIAAPAMTSFVDVAGLMAYFLIAQKVFALFGIEM